MNYRRFLQCLLGCALTMPLYAMDNDLQQMSALIKAGQPISRDEGEKLFLSVHADLTPDERLKAITLFEEPDWILLEILYESPYATKEKAAILGQLQNREMEFGVEELIVEVAAELAGADLDEARKWVSRFSKAEYGKGCGLSAVLQVAHDKDPTVALTMLRKFNDAEADAIIGYADLPDFEMTASAWQAEVNQFQSKQLKEFLLDWPIVFKYAKESPQAALDYINGLPADKRNARQGRQVVWSLLQRKVSHTEIIDWIENKLPTEARSDELYGQLATDWAGADPESFQEWFSKLKPGPRRDEVIFGFVGHDRPVDWQEAYTLAGTIINQEKRQTKVAWVLGAWQRSDPLAAEDHLEEADITERMRSHLRRTIESTKKRLNSE